MTTTMTAGETSSPTGPAAEPAGPRLRGAPRRLRGPVRPAARADLQAQAGHHRDRAVPGHRRVHRATSGRWPDGWDLDQASYFLVVAATLLDLKAARLLPSGEVDDEEDLALLEARDLLFARLLQYRAYKEVAAVFAGRMAAAGRRFPRRVPMEPRFAAAAARGAARPRPGRVRRDRRPRADAAQAAGGLHSSTCTPPAPPSASRPRSSPGGCASCAGPRSAS